MNRSGAGPTPYQGGSVTRRAPKAVLVLLAAALSAAPAAAATPSRAQAAPHAASIRTHAVPAAAIPVPSDAPFWSGRPNGPAFTRLEQDRLARAQRAIERMLAVAGPRTVPNTLQPYDDALLELDQAGSQASLIEEVHPDSVVRDAAEKATQDVSAYASRLS